MSNDNALDRSHADQILWGLSKPDWEKWKSAVSVRLWQAVALACDLDPSNFQITNTPLLDRTFKVPPAQFEDLLNMAKGSIGADGILKPVSISKESLDNTEVNLENFSKWAKSIKFELPNGFPCPTTSNALPELETPLGERERSTLLTIIAALADEANIDISKPSKAASLIEALTIRLDTRVAARTIENHLNRIPSALEKGTAK